MIARIGALLLALMAIGCLTAAIAGMVTGRPGDRWGFLLRGAAVLCFAGAVVLVTAVHHT